MPRPTIESLISSGHIERIAHGDDGFILRSTLPISLQAMVEELSSSVQPTLDGLNADPVIVPSLDLYRGNRRDISKKIAALEIGKLILENGYISYAQCAQMMETVRHEFICFTNQVCCWDLPPTAQIRGLEIFLYIPVLKIPFRCLGQSGSDPSVLLPNVPSLQK